MRLGGLQVAKCVFDRAAQQQRGHEPGCGLQHRGQMVARAFGFSFAEVDQRLGITRLQVVGHGFQGGVDFARASASLLSARAMPASASRAWVCRGSIRRTSL